MKTVFQVIVLLLVVSVASTSQTLAFSPQDTIGKKVQLWAVTGCGVRPGAISTIYTIATKHGISWITPATAAERLSRLTVWGKIVRYGGFASAGTTALLQTDLISSNVQIKQGVTYGAMFLSVLLPLVTKSAPTVDASVGKDLTVDVNGCTTAAFYSLPSAVSPFVETLQ